MKQMARFRRALAIAAAAVVALALSACASRAPEKPVAADTGAPTAAPSPSSSGADLASAVPRSGASPSDLAARSRRSAPNEMSVYFEFDSSALSEHGRHVVQQHAQYLAAERAPIRVEGNADERGSREYNIALGQRRAEAVRQMLTIQGTAPDNVEAVSYGEERPRCDDASEQCWATNRRVDFVYMR